MPVKAEITRAHKQGFLEAFAECGVVTVAARAAKVATRTVYNWRQEDEQFAKAFDEAEVKAHELLVMEARRRGREGYDEFVVSGGKLIERDGQPLLQRRFSDQLLKFLIERREGRPVQRVEHGEASPKPKEIAPAYLADVLAELNRRGVVAAGEDSDLPVSPGLPGA